MKKLKTITIEGSGGPIASLCPGHVTATVFNKAHRAEGWIGDWVRKDTLKHEYWTSKKLKSGVTRYRQAEKGTKGARKFTVMGW